MGLLSTLSGELHCLELQVDITVNNILAIVNTKLLADYVSIDDRLLQLCYVIKHWAKRRQVNIAKTFCHLWLCTFFLQGSNEVCTRRFSLVEVIVAC